MKRVKFETQFANLSHSKILSAAAFIGSPTECAYFTIATLVPPLAVPALAMVEMAGINLTHSDAIIFFKGH